MLRARRSLLVLLLALPAALLAIPAHPALGIEQVPTDAGTDAARMTWPESVDLLAAEELNLPAGSYDWQVTTLVLTGSDFAFLPGSGVLIATSGNALVQINGRNTLRLDHHAALTMYAGDRWQLRAADNAGATVLVVELLPAGMAGTEDNAITIGPLNVPGGSATLALVNIDKNRGPETARDEVMQSALRPGVSIRHDESGIPSTPAPDQEYDRWVVALFPHGEQPMRPDTPVPATQAPVATPTMPATPPAPATPTIEPTWTPTATPTIELTWTPTATPTDVPADTPTPPPTEPPPTPAWTPTAAPSAPPAMEPAPTPTETPASNEAIEEVSS